jgi:hypothetical protein
MSMKQLLATILCLLAILGAGAAPAEEIVGFSAEAKDYHYMILGTYPYEEDGTEAPLVWRVLGVQDQVATLFTEDVIDVRQMIELETYKQLSKKKYPRKIQDWTESDLYVWMCGELAETILRQQDFRPAELIDATPWTALPCDVGYFPQEPRLSLWCYPNDTPESILGTPRPSLEFECRIGGETCSFEVPLPPLPRGCTKEVALTIDGPDEFHYIIR